MPNINIYLDEELYNYVRKDKSKIIQEALRIKIDLDEVGKEE